MLFAVMKRSLAVLLALAASLPLVSCSTSPSATQVSPSATQLSPSSTQPSSTQPSSSAPPSASSSSVTARPSSASAGGYPAADVCAYLTQQLPALKAIGTPVGAHANLVGNLFGFLQSHAIPADSGALDEATKAECPQVRTEVLAVTGLTSFAEL